MTMPADLLMIQKISKVPMIRFLTPLLLKIWCLIHLKFGLVGELGTGRLACASWDWSGNGPFKLLNGVFMLYSKRYIDDCLRERTRNV
jgi:hypothetical protein